MGFLRKIMVAIGLAKKRGSGPPPPKGVSKPTILGSTSKPRSEVIKGLEKEFTPPSQKPPKKLKKRRGLSGEDPYSPTVLGG